MYTFKQTLLATAGILLLANPSFAQVNNADKKIRIKIEVNDDGKQVSIDTTFTDEAAFHQWMHDNNYDEPKQPPAPPVPPTAPNPSSPPLPPSAPAPPSEPKSSKGKDFQIRIFSNKEKAEMKLEMDKLNKELRESMKELDDMKFDVNINGDDDMDIVIKRFSGDNDSLFYSFSLPDCEKIKKEMQDLSENMKSFSFSFDIDDDKEEINSDKKQKRTSKVIIIEKSDKKNGSTKRKDKENELPAEEKSKTKENDTDRKSGNGQTSYELSPSNFELSPNPGKGKYKLSFDLPSTEPVTVKVLDFAGRQLFSDLAENFTGHYQNEFDITGKSKGTYLLQIRQGENWMHKKFLLN